MTSFVDTTQTFTSIETKNHDSFTELQHENVLYDLGIKKLSIDTASESLRDLESHIVENSNMECIDSKRNPSDDGDDDGDHHSTSTNTTTMIESTVEKTDTVTPQTSMRMRQVTPGIQHFDILKLIGKGSFGSVYIVKNKINDEYYAMKVISKKLLRKKNNISYMKSERDILIKISHPFIVSLHYAFQTHSKLFLIMDFLGGGELFYHLRRNGLILENQARVYFAEMILAIEFLHGIGVIHRDLKPENVLLRSNGHICITDFGLAKEIGDGVTTRTLCGTSEYMAPEMLTRNGYGKAVDWWSLGALFYEVLVGRAPFIGKDQKELDRKILSEKLSLPSFLTSNCHSLLKGMIERDINKRLGAQKSNMFTIGGVAALKQHPFFVGINWLDVLHGRVPAPISLDTLFAPSNHSSKSQTPINKPVTSKTPTKSSTTSKNTSTIATTELLSSSLSKPSHSSTKLETIDILASPFHEEFTNQAISYSLLEDCYDTIHSVVTGSPLYTPTRTPPHELSNTDQIDENNINPNEFAGFEYQVRMNIGYDALILFKKASGPLLCSEDAYQKFEEDLMNKLVKLQKKRNQQKVKQQKQSNLSSPTSNSHTPLSICSQKSSPVIVSTPNASYHISSPSSNNRGQDNVVDEPKHNSEQNKQQKNELERLEMEYEQLSSIRKDLEQNIESYEEKSLQKDRVNKRSRLLRKKLRDIQELEMKADDMSNIIKPFISNDVSTNKIQLKDKTIVKTVTLNSEQLEKISKKGMIEKELRELEIELQKLESNESNIKSIESSEEDKIRQKLEKAIQQMIELDKEIQERRSIIHPHLSNTYISLSSPSSNLSSDESKISNNSSTKIEGGIASIATTKESNHTPIKSLKLSELSSTSSPSPMRSPNNSNSSSGSNNNITMNNSTCTKTEVSKGSWEEVVIKKDKKKK